MKLKELKIIFFGTSFFAKEILRNLLDNDVNIDLVITQPDRPAGRKKYFRPTDVKSLALERGIETKEFEKIKQEEINFIKNANPDLIITASYGLIIPKEILEIPKYGSVNIHPSLLPELRGSSPIQAALLQNLPETGISFMKMNEKMDAGPVFFQKKLKIDKEDVYPTLEKKLLNLANNYLIENLEKYLTKELKPKEQDHKKATLTRLISRKDGRIFWSYSAQEIYNKFRAFYGWPGIYCFWKKDGFLKKIAFNEISRKEQGDEKKRQPGEVFKDSFGNVCIQSGEGLILPLEIQLEGKKSMSIKDFINGNPSFIGSQIK